MSSLNKVCLIGNVGKDPEIKTFQNGNPVASFSIATTNTWKDKTTGEKKTHTEWHRIVCFVPNLCIIIQQYVRKGSKIYLEGSLKYREYEKDGVKTKITEVVLNEFGSKLILLGKRDEDESESYTLSTETTAGSFKKATFDIKELDDEIPF